MDAPRHSVLLPVHNGIATLAESLESIRAQHHNSLEVLAIEDHSTDDSPALLKAWQNKLPLRILKPEQGGNWMAATNLGLKEAKGEWIHFLHQDDRWEPNRLLTLETAMAQFPEVRFFCHDTQFLNSEGRNIGPWKVPIPGNTPVKASTLLPRYATQNFLAIPAGTFRRELIQEVGLLREDLWFLSDWHYWLRLIHAAGSAVRLPLPLAGFRIHHDSQTTTRSTDEADLRRQFAEVRTLVTELCDNHPDPEAAQVNEDLTITLANWSHGQAGVPWRTFGGWLKLGPIRGSRFLCDTRLFERVWPRVRLRRRNRKAE